MTPKGEKQSTPLRFQDPSGMNCETETSGKKFEAELKVDMGAEPEADFETELGAELEAELEVDMKTASEAGFGADSGDGSGAGFFDGIDIIIPIPLTRKREWNRGYNQSGEIAKGISRYTKIPIVTNAVKRTRFTQSQTHLKSEQRKQNVENAFKLLKPSLIKGKHILLVDDIITTGATVYSCAKELQKAGNITFSIISAGFTKG